MLRLLLLVFFLSAFAAQTPPTPPAPDSALVYDVPITARLGNAQPRIAYAFDGLRGEVVEITLEATSGDLDPVLAVLDNNGTLLAQADDGGVSRGAHIEALRLPGTSRYYVVVGRFGFGLGTTAGEFRLLVARIGVSSASGSALRYGDTVLNQITDTTPQVYYSFRAQRGDIVNIEMQRVSGSLDAYLQVVDNRALVVADNDEVIGSGSLDARIDSLLIEQDGTYVIIASRFGQAAGRSSGDFTLTLREAADSGLGNAPQSALTLPDAPVEGELDSTRVAQYWRFEGRANDLVTLRMERINGSLDSFVPLLDAQGRELASNDDTAGSQNSAIVDFRLPADGAYIIRATRFEGEAGTSAGRYRLTLERGENVAAAVPVDVRFIPYGSTLTGAITSDAPVTTYAFYGEAGDVITASLTRADGDLDPVLILQDATGQNLVRDDDSGGGQNALIERFTLPASGVYTLVATRFDGAGRPPTAGSYLLVLAQRFD